MDPQQEETQTEDSNTLTDEQLEYWLGVIATDTSSNRKEKQ